VLKGIIVEGKRAHKKGGSGKGHKSHAIAFKLSDKIENGIVGPFQPIGFNILCQHTLGGIECKENINTFAFYVNPFKAVLGARKSDKAHKNSTDNKDIFYPSLAA